MSQVRPNAQSLELRTVLEKVFDEMRGEWRRELSPKDYEARRSDFVFHMTDWLEDFDQLSAALKARKGGLADGLTESIVGFLYHAVPHLNAAGRLLLDEIPDAFEPSA